jgi:hypothetical protein
MTLRERGKPWKLSPQRNRPIKNALFAKNSCKTQFPATTSAFALPVQQFYKLKIAQKIHYAQHCHVLFKFTSVLYININ